jgi:hypothetical protein
MLKYVLSLQLFVALENVFDCCSPISLVSVQQLTFDLNVQLMLLADYMQQCRFVLHSY